MYVALFSAEDRLWTVGFFDPQGKWHGLSDHADEDDVAERIHFLNGGTEGRHAMLARLKADALEEEWVERARAVDPTSGVNLADVVAAIEQPGDDEEVDL